MSTITRRRTIFVNTIVRERDALRVVARGARFFRGTTLDPAAVLRLSLPSADETT